MKRSSIAALVIGVLVSAIVIALHATRLLAPLERAIMTALAGSQPPAKRCRPEACNTSSSFFSRWASLWLVITSCAEHELYWPLAILVVELLVISWVCLLYQVSFQPLPSVFAVGSRLSLAASGYAKYGGAAVAPVSRGTFSEVASRKNSIARVATGELPFNAEAKSYETTAVVCDIANKHDLAEECSPALLAEITGKFIAHATESFLKAGAYIETVTGEGIVAIFGFPAADADQAERATRHALSLLESFEKLREGRDEAFQKLGVHFGISSGTMIVTPAATTTIAPSLLATGEPVELARRFCIANRFYGSSILIGPRTFELASKAVVARPIDFLSGVDVRERHEIYEPLRLATEATPEEIARRDSFWNGVVLYREKRWAEAYSQFQKARGPERARRRAAAVVCAPARAARVASHRYAPGVRAAALRKIEYPAAIRELIAQLRQMPGVGPRSAERIALWMVQARGDQPERIAQAISATRATVRPCARCGFFTMDELCEICSDPTRAADLLCVVEQPTDILPLEKTSAFRGRYHSLGGRISPLDHVGPDDLRIEELLARVKTEGFSEVILALAADVEGEATTNYLVELLKPFPRKPHPHRAWFARRRRA